MAPRSIRPTRNVVRCGTARVSARPPGALDRFWFVYSHAKRQGFGRADCRSICDSGEEVLPMRARRSRPLAIALLAVAALTTMIAAPAAAVRYGTDDGTAHPYVGLMVAKAANGNPLWRCSGTLLSSRIFLTAGHCVGAPTAHVEIWFSAGPEPLGAGYPAAGANRCAGITKTPLRPQRISSTGCGASCANRSGPASSIRSSCRSSPSRSRR